MGFPQADTVNLAQLASKTLQEAVQACGEQDELTQEIASLHKILLRIRIELDRTNTSFPDNHDDRHRELDELCIGCERALKVMESILGRYNKLSEEERRERKLWQRVRFGNGEVKHVAEIRSKLSTYTNAIQISLNLCLLGALGRAENRINSFEGDLEGIRWKLDWVLASMSVKRSNDNLWSYYMTDVSGFWRELRRGLIREGYDRFTLHDQKRSIKLYIQELGHRGVFEATLDTEPTKSETSTQNPIRRRGSPISEADEADAVSPESPRTPKYLRFDKAIHIGSINPRAMNARTPEQQEAHDRRKEIRRPQLAVPPETRSQHKDKRLWKTWKSKPRVIQVT